MIQCIGAPFFLQFLFVKSLPPSAMEPAPFLFRRVCQCPHPRLRHVFWENQEVTTSFLHPLSGLGRTLRSRLLTLHRDRSKDLLSSAFFYPRARRCCGSPPTCRSLGGVAPRITGRGAFSWLSSLWRLDARHPFHDPHRPSSDRVQNTFVDAFRETIPFKSSDDRLFADPQPGVFPFHVDGAVPFPPRSDDLYDRNGCRYPVFLELIGRALPVPRATLFFLSSSPSFWFWVRPLRDEF